MCLKPDLKRGALSTVFSAGPAGVHAFAGLTSPQRERGFGLSNRRRGVAASAPKPRGEPFSKVGAGRLLTVCPGAPEGIAPPAPPRL